MGGVYSISNFEFSIPTSFPVPVSDFEFRISDFELFYS
jgi:hypothetical protein